MAFLSPTDFIVVSPLLQNITASEVSDLLLSLILQLTVGFCPFRKQLIKALHLLCAPMTDSSELLLLDMNMPVSKSLPAGLDAPVGIEIFF